MSADAAGSPAVSSGRRRSGPILTALRRETRDLQVSGSADRVRVKLAEAYARAADDAAGPVELERAADKLEGLLVQVFGPAPTAEGVGAGDGDGARPLHAVMDGPPAMGD